MIYFRIYKKSEVYRDSPRLGLDWYAHHKSHKYKGMSISIILPYFIMDIDIIYKNPAEYKKCYAEFDKDVK